MNRLFKNVLGLLISLVVIAIVSYLRVSSGEGVGMLATSFGILFVAIGVVTAANIKDILTHRYHR